MLRIPLRFFEISITLIIAAASAITITLSMITTDKSLGTLSNSLIKDRSSRVTARVSNQMSIARTAAYLMNYPMMSDFRNYPYLNNHDFDPFRASWTSLMLGMPDLTYVGIHVRNGPHEMDILSFVRLHSTTDSTGLYEKTPLQQWNYSNGVMVPSGVDITTATLFPHPGKENPVNATCDIWIDQCWAENEFDGEQNKDKDIACMPLDAGLMADTTQGALTLQCHAALRNASGYLLATSYGIITTHIFSETVRDILQYGKQERILIVNRRLNVVLVASHGMPFGSSNPDDLEDADTKKIYQASLNTPYGETLNVGGYLVQVTDMTFHEWDFELIYGMKKDLVFGDIDASTRFTLIINIVIGVVAMVFTVMLIVTVATPLSKLTKALNFVGNLEFALALECIEGNSLVKEIADIQVGFRVVIEKLDEYSKFLPQSLLGQLELENNVPDSPGDAGSVCTSVDNYSTNSQFITVRKTSTFAPSESSDNDFHNIDPGVVKKRVVGAMSTNPPFISLINGASTTTIQSYFGDFYETIIDTCKDTQGVCELTDGGSVLTTWNASINIYGRLTQRSAVAALAVRDAVAALAGKHPCLQSSRPSIGIAQGKVQCGIFGNVTKKFTILGHCVHIAQQLSKLSIPLVAKYDIPNPVGILIDSSVGEACIRSMTCVVQYIDITPIDFTFIDDRKPSILYGLASKANIPNAEWMYAADSGAGAVDATAANNEAFRLIRSERFSQARSALDNTESSTFSEGSSNETHFIIRRRLDIWIEELIKLDKSPSTIVENTALPT